MRQGLETMPGNKRLMEHNLCSSLRRSWERTLRKAATFSVFIFGVKLNFKPWYLSWNGLPALWAVLITAILNSNESYAKGNMKLNFNWRLIKFLSRLIICWYMQLQNHTPWCHEPMSSCTQRGRVAKKWLEKVRAKLWASWPLTPPKPLPNILNLSRSFNALSLQSSCRTVQNSRSCCKTDDASWLSFTFLNSNSMKRPAGERRQAEGWWQLGTV